jgi:hypothetical protein
VWVIVHLEYLLLLSSQVLRLPITVHHCETHRSWHKNVVVVSIRSSPVWRLHKIILVWSSLLN